MSDNVPSILLVEDNPIDCVLVKSIIGGRYSLSIARSASEAIKLIASVQFDVILLDLELPDSFGNSVKMLRCATAAPIITISASSEQSRDGAFAFLCKPINGESLLDYIAAALASEKVRPCREFSERIFSSIDSKIAMLSKASPSHSKSARMRSASAIVSLPAMVVLLAAVFIAGGEYRGRVMHSPAMGVEAKPIKQDAPIDDKLIELRERPSLPAVVWFRTRSIPKERMDEAIVAMVSASKSKDRDTANAAECALTAWGVKCLIK